MQTSIIGVRFTKIGKVYHFDAASLGDVQKGEHVVVDTARGRHLGEVVQVLSQTPSRPEGGWKHVDRRATPRGPVASAILAGRQTEAMISCRARAAELRLRSIKIVAAEYNFDGSRLVLMFSTDSEEKPDLKSLRKDMQAAYPHQPGGATADRPSGCRQDPGRHGRLRPRDTLLLQVPSRISAPYPSRWPRSRAFR